jgi:hypothetical protein
MVLPVHTLDTPETTARCEKPVYTASSAGFTVAQSDGIEARGTEE